MLRRALARLRITARLLLYFVAPVALVLLPLVALAQAVTDPALPQIDVIAIVNMIPLPAAVKAAILVGFPLLYWLCAMLRRFTSPASPLGKAVRAVLDGIRHPSEAATASTSSALVASKDDAGTAPPPTPTVVVARVATGGPHITSARDDAP